MTRVVFGGEALKVLKAAAEFYNTTVASAAHMLVLNNSGATFKPNTTKPSKAKEEESIEPATMREITKLVKTPGVPPIRGKWFILLSRPGQEFSYSTNSYTLWKKHDALTDWHDNERDGVVTRFKTSHDCTLQEVEQIKTLIENGEAYLVSDVKENLDDPLFSDFTAFYKPTEPTNG